MSVSPASIASPAPTEALGSRPPSAQPLQKRRKSGKGSGDNLDYLVCRTLKDLHERREEDDSELFGKQVGATIRRFNPRQRAQAKLRIQQVLVDVEFPESVQGSSYGMPMNPYC